jgi:hypothetical protein
MSRVLAVLGGLALLATGVAIGAVVATDAGPPDAEPAGRVVVRSTDGAERELTPSEAAARIERLEAQVARIPRARAAVPDDDGGEDDESASSAPRRPDPEIASVPVPRKQDGTPYSVAELRDLAIRSADPVLRRAAIQALRRDDTPEARRILEGILTDAKTPADMRVEAAKSLARAPHRDAEPENLVKLLAATDLPPDVRAEIADGVTRLRDRGAWMSEIAAQLAKETDPAVRGLLFESVARSAWDPAAKDLLLSMATNPATPLADAQAAVLALARTGNDRRVLDALGPLLDHADPVLREQAVLAWAKAGRLSQDEIAAKMRDSSPGVRAAAFSAALAALPKNATKEQKQAREELLQSAARTALTDSAPEVRRSALAWTGAMSEPLRNKVLETARNDSDPLVAIEAFARSPAPVVRAEPERVLTQLDSTDPKVRDAAYRLVARTWGVDVPFRATWNAAARARAVAAIRAQVATK